MTDPSRTPEEPWEPEERADETAPPEAGEPAEPADVETAEVEPAGVESAGPELTDPLGRELASPLVRLGARVADAFILYSLINLALFGVSALLGLEADDEVTGGQQAVLLLGMFSVPVAYETIGTARWGRTGGKYLLGAATVDRDTGGWPSWGRSFNRSVLLYAPFFVLPPYSFLVWPAVVVTMLAVDAQRRGPEDRVARTLVVRTGRPDRLASRGAGPAPDGAPAEPPPARRGRRRGARPSSPPEKKAPPGVEARKRRWQERGPGR